MSNDNVVSLAAPAQVSDPLTDLLRTGARRLVEAAVTAEFEEYLSSFSAEELARISHRFRNLECDLCRTPLDEVLTADVRCTNADTGGDFADAQGPCGRWECETDVFRASRACAPLSVVPIVSDLFLANGGTTQAGAIEVPFVDWPVLWQRSRHRDKTGRRTATRGAR